MSIKFFFKLFVKFNDISIMLIGLIVNHTNFEKNEQLLFKL